MEENTLEATERKFQEDRLEGKKELDKQLEARDIELSNEIAKVQGISLNENECEIGE